MPKVPSSDGSLVPSLGSPRRRRGTPDAAPPLHAGRHQPARAQLQAGRGPPPRPGRPQGQDVHREGHDRVEPPPSRPREGEGRGAAGGSEEGGAGGWPGLQ